MKRKLLIPLLFCIYILLVLSACRSSQNVSAELEIVAFDKVSLIEMLCAHTRAYDSQFIVNFIPSETLESDIEDAIKTAQSTRFDCAYNTDSVVWNLIEHKNYVYANFKILYSPAASPKPAVVNMDDVDWTSIVEDMLQKRQTEYSICIPASQTNADIIFSSIRGSLDSQDKAFFSYAIENSSLSLLSYEDYYVPLLMLAYREDALPVQDVYRIGSLADAAQYMMDCLSDGDEKITVFADGVSKEQLQLLLWIAQINDSAEMVEEALTGQGDYFDNDDGSYIAVLSIQYSGTKQKREECRVALKGALQEIEAEIKAKNLKDQKSLYEAICKAVAERAEYDYEMSEASIEKKLTDEMRFLRTAYGALCGGHAVCTSYSAAFKAVCDRFSLPSWVVMGYYEESGHAWNAVLVDGEVRYVDPTFYDISKSNTHVLFTPEQYAKRPYRSEDGYVMPDWYTDAFIKATA